MTQDGVHFCKNESSDLTSLNMSLAQIIPFSVWHSGKEEFIEEYGRHFIGQFFDISSIRNISNDSLFTYVFSHPLATFWQFRLTETITISRKNLQ